MNTRIPKLLVIEDNADDEKLILRALTRLNREMDVEVVRDGKQAIEYLCGQPGEVPQPDLVLLDWKLPKYMGADVLRKVRGSSCCSDLPVVAFSSSDLPEDQEQCRELGGNAYVTKPVDYAKFMATVENLVSSYLVKESVTSQVKSKAICLLAIALGLLSGCWLEPAPV